MTDTIYDLLETTRKDKGLSQRKAAAELATTPTTWRQWSRGQIPGWEWINPFSEFTGYPNEIIIEAIANQARENLRLRVLGLAAHLPLLQAA